MKVHDGDHPGGPVVKTPCFHCRGHRFSSWEGNFTSHMLLAVVKKKTKKVEDENNGAKKRKNWVMARKRGPLLILRVPGTVWGHSMC